MEPCTRVDLKIARAEKSADSLVPAAGRSAVRLSPDRGNGQIERVVEVRVAVSEEAVLLPQGGTPGTGP